MFGILWLVYLIWFSDNTRAPDFEPWEGFFVFGNFPHLEPFQEPELPEWLPDPDL
jgi:hypothetical protein